MSFASSLALQSLMDEDQLDKFESWAYSLTENAKQTITVSILSNAMEMTNKQAQDVLDCLVSSGYAEKKFAIKCPNCFTGISSVGANELITFYQEYKTCPYCEDEIELSMDDIFVYYSLLDIGTPPEDDKYKRVTINYDDTGADTLSSQCQNGFDLNKYLFCPTPTQYDELRRMFSCVFKQQKSTARQGDTLEDFVRYLFNLCPIFSAAKISMGTINQIDCCVRVKAHSATNSIFNYTGKVILIECKNEAKQPDGGYLQKLHDIMGRVCSGTNMTKLGIVCSIEKAPKTYATLAREYYLLNSTVMLAMDKCDFNKIVNKKENLLDRLEEKTLAIALGTNTVSKLYPVQAVQ